MTQGSARAQPWAGGLKPFGLQIIRNPSIESCPHTALSPYALNDDARAEMVSVPIRMLCYDARAEMVSVPIRMLCPYTNALFTHDSRY